MAGRASPSAFERERERATREGEARREREEVDARRASNERAEERAGAVVLHSGVSPGGGGSSVATRRLDPSLQSRSVARRALDGEPARGPTQHTHQQHQHPAATHRRRVTRTAAARTCRRTFGDTAARPHQRLISSRLTRAIPSRPWTRSSVAHITHSSTAVWSDALSGSSALLDG